MVLGVKDVRSAVYDPAPVPFSVLLSLTVGEAEVLQHTPLELTVAPPSSVTSPPETAAVLVSPLILSVETAGKVALFFVHESITATEKKSMMLNNVRTLPF
jgi:hypothetical protein